MFQFYTYKGDAVDADASTQRWLNLCADHLEMSIDNINFIWCTDEELLEVNKEYLNHDYYTDIITFDLRDTPAENHLADLFISTERVRENALAAAVSYETELKRVMIHGILHLCGFNDKSPEQKALMTSKENFYLSL